jgi:hypothetical protein
MSDLYTNTGDGTCSITSQSSWADARDHSGSGGTVLTSSSLSGAALGVNRSATRGGGSAYAVYRAFMYFDTSGITGTVSSATIKIYGTSSNDGSAIAVKSTAFGGDGGTALAATDLNNIVGFSSGSSLAGLATDYSAAITTTGYSTSGYNDFTGTADLRADMQNNNVVIICFMDYTNDYLNSALTSNGFLNYGAYFTDNTGTDKDPYIEYEVAAAGYTHDVNSVAAASIGKVNSVATASIGKINSVD